MSEQVRRLALASRLRAVFGAGLVCASLTACEISRPGGAYTYDASMPDLSMNMGTDEDDAPPEVIDRPDSDPVEEDPAVDGGAGSLRARVAKLVDHRYLMRMDFYSSNSATQSGVTLKIDNILSNLMMVDLVFKDGALQGVETLCHQTLQTICRQSCEDWTHTLSDALPARFQDAARRVTREYAVAADGTLQGKQAFLALGFDEPEPSMSTVIPDDESDPRVWRLQNPDQLPFVGVYDNFKVDLKPTVFTTLALDCGVASAQLFGTAFTGRLDLDVDNPLSGAAPSFLPPLRVDTTGTDARTVWAQGTPADRCSKESLGQSIATQNASNTNPITSVSFRPYDGPGHEACPTLAAYQSAFPGNASRPTSFR